MKIIRILLASFFLTFVLLSCSEEEPPEPNGQTTDPTEEETPGEDAPGEEETAVKLGGKDLELSEVLFEKTGEGLIIGFEGDDNQILTITTSGVAKGSYKKEGRVNAGEASAIYVDESGSVFVAETGNVELASVEESDGEVSGTFSLLMKSVTEGGEFNMEGAFYQIEAGEVAEPEIILLPLRILELDDDGETVQFTETFTYNENHQLIESRYLEEGGEEQDVNKYYYDGQGRLIKLEEYYGTASLELDETHLYTYSAGGLLEKYEIFEGGELDGYYTFVFDAEGRLQRTNDFNNLSEYTYTYEYDEKGNVIKESKAYVGEEPYLVEERVFDDRKSPYSNWRNSLLFFGQGIELINPSNKLEETEKDNTGGSITTTDKVTYEYEYNPFGFPVKIIERSEQPFGSGTVNEEIYLIEYEVFVK